MPTTHRDQSRRRVIATTAVALATAAAPVPARAATAPDPAARPAQPDVPVLRADAERLHLKLPAQDGRRGEPVALRLTTTVDEPFTVEVGSTTGRTTVGIGRAERQQAATASARVSARKPAVFWVVPQETGEPGEPADQLDVSSPHDGLTIDVWTEPAGGEWRRAGEDGKELDLGIVGVHAALLRNGPGQEVIYWSSPRQRNADGSPKKDPGRPGQWLWNVYGLDDMEARGLDPKTLKTRDRIMDAEGGPPRHNIFCGGAAHLPDGRLLVAGGHVIPPDMAHEGHTSNGGHLHIYDPTRPGGWQLVEQPMSQVRWYPTVTCLPDGRMLIASGSRKVLEGNGNDGNPDGFWTSSGNSYEIFDPATGTLAELPPVRLIDTELLGKGESLTTYPHIWVLPRGGSGTAVALVEANRAWLYDYDPEAARPLDRADAVYRMRTRGSRSYPTYGSHVLLPLTADSPRARILAVGGQHESQTDHRTLSADQPATATAEILELDTSADLAAQRRWRRTGRMARPRVLCDTTLLADGTVLVSGGAERGWGDMNKDEVRLSELYDPGTETFTPAASNRTDRRYHSSAILQSDGTLLKAGSTGGFGAERLPGDKGYKWVSVHTDAERFYPPYLWRGPRPSLDAIATADGTLLRYGTPFTVAASGAGLDEGARVSVVRLGSTTHGNDMDQRYVWLRVTANRETDAGRLLTVDVPRNPASAPPGDYLLFVVDAAGVPSEARMVRLAH